MADNKEKSNIDDIFDILNELDENGDALPQEDAQPLEESALQAEYELFPEAEPQAELQTQESIDEILSPQEPQSDPRDKNGDGISSIDQILEMIDAEKLREEPLAEVEFPEETEIPDAIFGHLTNENDDAEIPVIGESNLHFTEESDSQLEEAEESEALTEDDEDDDYDDDEYEVVTKVGRVTRFFKGMSFVPKAFIYILVVVLASVYLSYYIITIGNDVFALVSDSREVVITIDEDDTDETVAQMLVDNEIIEYGWVYELYMKYRGTGDDDSQYIPGEHTLNQNFNYSQIIETLTTGASSQKIVTVTIPEGYTVDQIIDLLVENGIGERTDYVEAINNYPYKWEFVEQLTELGYPETRKYRLEGYLFPDTYDFYNDTDEVYVINKILNAFYDKFWKEFTNEDSQGSSYQKKLLEEQGMTFDDIVVLASMVQSEGGLPEDFYYISYVFQNRLDNPELFPYLDSDATIQYVLPERVGSDELDTKFDSPYNTYINQGLPPGAICNPSLEALNAVLFPAAPVDSNDNEINAYYFVANNAGKTYFASTLSGHENNIEQVKKDNEAIKAGTYGQ